jgi:hypothetical protein
MEEKQIPWTRIYLGLMISLVIQISLMYALTLAYS